VQEPWYRDFSFWFALVADILAVYAIYITRQTDAREVRREKEDQRWATRSEKLVKHLIRINPSMSVKEQGADFEIGLYTTIFPERELQHLIERFLVETDRNRCVFTPRTLEPHELRSSIVQETITKTEKGLEAFSVSHPKSASYYLGL